MADIIPINEPDRYLNPNREALLLAINEACAGTEAALTCTLDTPCPECKALANALSQALIRAFMAGQASVIPRGDLR